MVFNMASEQLNSLKEYFIKLVRHELFFKEFHALEHVSFKVNKGEVIAWWEPTVPVSPPCSRSSPACSSPRRAP